MDESLCVKQQPNISSTVVTPFPVFGAAENGKRERPDGEEVRLVDRLWEQMDAQYTR